MFQKYGKLVDVTIPLDYHSGFPKGYCFIEYEDPRDAEEAHYRMARQRLFGRELEIEFARGNRKSNQNVIVDYGVTFKKITYINTICISLSIYYVK